MPELFSWSGLPIPGPLERHLVANPDSWVLHLFPPLPLDLFFHVPVDFQRPLNSLSLLLIETVVVFIFAAWMLKTRPRAADQQGAAKAWLLMVLATLVWSFLARNLLLGLLVRRQIARFDSDIAFDDIALYLLQSYWEALPLFYLSIPLWACVPVWLHFRMLRPGTLADARPAPEAAPLTRACTLASFLLGFLLLHYGLVQGVYLGLWPWIAETRDIFIAQEELELASLPLVLSQIVMPLIAGVLAAVLYSRKAPSQGAGGFQLVALPLLSGVGALALANLLCFSLVWLVAYADYRLIEGLLLGFAYDPEGGGFLLLMGFNLVSLLLLCGVTLFLRGSGKDGPQSPAEDLPRLPAT